MADNDDYMVAKATDDEITENMWDRLQEGINANRRYRLKGVAGGDNMRYSSTKVVWDSDIYIYFTRESDGAWVYNKVNANPTTGITCNNDDLLYVTLNDTTATVLTVSSADYASMPTDDTGRILVLGAVVASTWYGDAIGYTDVNVETIITAELADGQSIDNAIDALILTHKNISGAHHTKYALADDLIANEITVIKAIDDASINNTKWDYIAALTENPQTHMSAANPHSGSAATGDLHSETHVLAVTGPHTGTLPLADLEVGVSGDIIIRGASDWEILNKGSDTDVLTLVSGVPDWQPAGSPAAHDLDSASHGDVSAVSDHIGLILYQAVSGTWSGLLPPDAVGEILRCSNADGSMAWGPQSGIDHGSLGGLGDDDHSKYRYWNDGYTFIGTTTGSAVFTNQTGSSQQITYANPSTFQVYKKNSNYSFQCRLTDSHSPGNASLYHSDNGGASWTVCDTEFMVQYGWEVFTCSHKFTSDERNDNLMFRMVFGWVADQEYQAFSHATLLNGYKVETGTE